MVEFDTARELSIATVRKRGGVSRNGNRIETAATISSAPPSSLPERETGTVRRVLMLLSSLADRPGESAQSLAARVNLPRSSVHRLLTMLRGDCFADSEP